MSAVRALLPYLAVGVLLTIFPLLAPTAIVNTGVYVLIFTLACVGLSLLMGLAGQVSLGHAAFFAVGAYTQAILVTRYDVPLLGALPVSVLASMLLALLVGFPLLRLRGHFLALATLGLGIIVTVVVRELSFTGGTSGIYGIPKPDLGGRIYDSPSEYFWLLSPVVLLGLALGHRLSHSRVGRALSAVNDSETAAECLGVDSFALRLRVFVLAAGYAGLAGVFYAHWLAVVNPGAANFPLSVSFLLIVVLGGLGTVWGALTGAVVVEALDEGMRDLMPILVPGASGEVQLLAFGIVLVLVIVLVPGGLAQMWDGVWRRLRPAAAAPDPAAGNDDEDDVRDTDHDSDRAEAMRTLLAQRRAGDDEEGVVLRAHGLRKEYGGVIALDDLSLELHPGRVVALIGPNGAGKTTAFNIITGVLAPTSGTVELKGTPVAGRPPHVAARLGATRTFQNLQVFGSTTVAGNVKVARHLRSRSGMLRGMLGLDRAEEAQVEADTRLALEATGLSQDADRPVTSLSFGRQRQVEVARALAMDPDVLLLDEPMAGLSSAERAELSEMLRGLRDAGVAVLLVEHDVAAVMALADQVVVLDDGLLIAAGPPDQVRADPAVIAAYLGSDEEADAQVSSAASRRPR